MHLQQYYDKIENVLKSQHLSSEKYEIELTIGYPTCMTRFMALAQAD